MFSADTSWIDLLAVVFFLVLLSAAVVLRYQLRAYFLTKSDR